MPLTNISNRVPAAHLEVLGKQAAKLASSCGVSLTDAVTQAVGSEDLNIEQVRRVVEFANTEAFNQKFASTAGNFRVVDIDEGPADPAQVIQNLNNAARTSEILKETSDYDMAPGFTDMTPEANVGDEGTNDAAIAKVAMLHSRLAGARQEVADTIESHKLQASDTLTELASHVKSAAVNGASIGALHSAWAKIDSEVADKVVTKLATIANSVNAPKVAGVVNPGHPVVTSFAKFAGHMRSTVTSYQQLQVIENEIARVAALLD